MKRQWRTRRQTLPQSDGQRRWDRAYQLLLEWTTPREIAMATADPSAVPPVAALHSNQEVEHAGGAVCTRLDPATGAAAKR
jgi:hypothetical protein